MGSPSSQVEPIWVRVGPSDRWAAMDMRSERTVPATVLSTVRYPLILVDREGGIEAVSHAAANLLTVSPEASRGSSIGEVTGSHGRLLHDESTRNRGAVQAAAASEVGWASLAA